MRLGWFNWVDWNLVTCLLVVAAWGLGHLLWFVGVLFILAIGFNELVKYIGLKK
jgi:hypothetical protein